MRPPLLFVLTLGLSLGVAAVGCDTETEDKIASLESRVAALEAEQAEQVEQAEQLRSAHAAALERLASQETRAADADAGRVALQERVTVMSEEIASLRAREEELQLRVDALDRGGAHKALTIGVKECDDYVARYSRCIDDKIPESARGASRRALEMSVEAWRKAAETEAGREGLAQACKTASEAVTAACGF